MHVQMSHDLIPLSTAINDHPISFTRDTFFHCQVVGNLGHFRDEGQVCLRHLVEGSDVFSGHDEDNGLAPWAGYPERRRSRRPDEASVPGPSRMRSGRRCRTYCGLLDYVTDAFLARSRCTIRMAMSAGVTPSIRDACPNVWGRNF